MVRIRVMFQIVGEKLKIMTPASHICRVFFGKIVTLRIAKTYSIKISSVRNGVKFGFPSTKPNSLIPKSDVAKSVIPAKDNIRYGLKLFSNEICSKVFTACLLLLLEHSSG